MRPAYAVRIAVRSPGAVLVVHVVDEQLIERLAGFEAEQDCMPMRDRLLQDGQSGPRCCARVAEAEHLAYAESVVEGEGPSSPSRVRGRSTTPLRPRG